MPQGLGNTGCYGCGRKTGYAFGSIDIGNPTAHHAIDDMALRFCADCAPALRVVALSVRQLIVEMKSGPVKVPDLDLQGYGR